MAISMLRPMERRYQVLTFSLGYSPSPEHVHHGFNVYNGQLVRTCIIKCEHQ